MKNMYKVFVLVIVAAMALAACGPKASQATDLLGAIKERGYILISTDPNYEPQSFLNTEGKRPADSKCPSDALTTAEMQGFDVDVAAELGKRLGVETCFATPNWDAITAGNWADKWDISVGSMTITPERMKVLYFTQPYYTTPAAIFVNKNNTTFAKPEDLSGKKVGSCSGCTYESYLDGSLVIPGENIDFLRVAVLAPCLVPVSL